jgi:hypothetical protein
MARPSASAVRSATCCSKGQQPQRLLCAPAFVDFFLQLNILLFCRFGQFVLADSGDQQRLIHRGRLLLQKGGLVIWIMTPSGR